MSHCVCSGIEQLKGSLKYVFQLWNIVGVYVFAVGLYVLWLNQDHPFLSFCEHVCVQMLRNIQKTFSLLTNVLPCNVVTPISLHFVSLFSHCHCVLWKCPQAPYVFLVKGISGPSVESLGLFTIIPSQLFPLYLAWFRENDARLWNGTVLGIQLRGKPARKVTETFT